VNSQVLRDFQIKKYSKTDVKIFLISPSSVFSVSLWFVFRNNLFPGSPLILVNPVQRWIHPVQIVILILTFYGIWKLKKYHR
jgi:hypothetical protein